MRILLILHASQAGENGRDRVRYIWIDTDEETAHQRILKRNRERDILNMWQVLQRNKELLVQLQRSHINFTKVKSEDLLEGGE